MKKPKESIPLCSQTEPFYRSLSLDELARIMCLDIIRTSVGFVIVGPARSEKEIDGRTFETEKSAELYLKLVAIAIAQNDFYTKSI